ncbi:hypothetical protein BJ170DRAFT_694111 [Xylariales sp. AK1849]|nr:hypothetical protein BJ170DRAFT_694111 [Xylariales sp. AK1849]
MKADSYKNLCLEQALLSPLKYRHGCIVVKGGKVIGRGYNDYRPGYDGGALKTGQLPVAASPRGGAALAVDKSKSKSKPNTKSAHFTAFESVSGMGGGHLANTALTMHSEMMAINSALASSSTLAATTVSYIKPCFKLSGDTKYERNLRRKAVAICVERACHQELGQGRQQGAASRNGKNKTNGQQQNRNQEHQHGQKKGTKKHNKFDRYGKHKQQRNSPQDTHECGHDKDGDGDDSHRDSDVDTRPEFHNIIRKSSSPTGKARSTQPSSPHQKLTDVQSITHWFDHVDNCLVPQGRAGATHRNFQDRKKHPKLIGADIYVTRLLNYAPPKQETVPGAENDMQTGDGELQYEMVCPSPTLPASSFPTGSLHDDVICKEAKPHPSASTTTDTSLSMKATESRPCYRCVAYMDSVGIKRVSWTNAKGDWESAKVRDLVDLLEGTSAVSFGEGGSGVGLFVTKHEVLKLRRVFGTRS